MTMLLFLTQIAFTSVLAYGGNRNKNIHESDYEDYDYTYDDDSDEGIVEKSEKTISTEENAVKVSDNEGNIVKVISNETTLRPATYEVTENVVDIPDNRTRLGPVIVNYTTPLPLNNANVVNPENMNNKPDSNGGNTNNNYGFVPPSSNANVPNSIGDPSDVPVHNKPNTSSYNYGLVNTDNEDAKTKKNYFSILHVKAEYDDKPSIPNIVQNNDRPSGFKEYILGLKRGIINGFYKLFNKKQSHVETQESPSNHYQVYHKYQESKPSSFEHALRYNEDVEYDRIKD